MLRKQWRVQDLTLGGGVDFVNGGFSVILGYISIKIRL